MSACILSIGTEITRGEINNTNSTALAERMTQGGFDVREIVSIADDRAVIVDTILRLAARFRVVICTGGLGPTTDDITASCVAQAAQVKLIRHEPSIEHIRRRFSMLGREMTPSNEKQAFFPEGADILPNPNGTAPGFAIHIGGCALYFMPGVPKEMLAMFEEHIAPKISKYSINDSCQIHLKTFGEGESKIGELLAGVEGKHPGVTLGYRVSFPEVEVKVFARAKSRDGAKKAAEKAAHDVRSILAPLVYSEGPKDTLPLVVSRMLRARGLTISIAESCTGGLVAKLLTEIPGASEFLMLDAVTYSNNAKTTVLRVDPDDIRAHGEVSRQTAEAMAVNVRKLVGTNIGVSITGIAGPTGGSETKPVGLVFVGFASDAGVEVLEKRFSGERVRIQTLSAYTALSKMLELAQKLSP